MKRAIFALTVVVAACTVAVAKEYRLQDNVEWLRDKLNYVCVKQMQVIADAMMRYHEKNGKFPSKPSDLKGYITAPPYDNGRIAYLIFISPADTTEFDYQADPWDFVDQHGSYVLNSEADLDSPDDILLSEKASFLWPGSRSHVFVDGHAQTWDEESLRKLQKRTKP